MPNLSPRQKAFLAAYTRTGTVASAARASRVARSSHYEWLADPDYQADFAFAEKEAIELLEAEARQRALEGLHEPVIYQGRLCFDVCRDKRTGEVIRNDEGEPLISDTPLYIRKPSDILLMFLLKSKCPEKYRDNANVQLTGEGGIPLSVQVEFVTPGDVVPTPQAA